MEFDVLEVTFHQLNTTGTFNRIWFNEKFPKQAKTASCNFTTIGRLMQYFGLATYKQGVYIKRNGYNTS